jgi:hypothetical protein
MLGPHILRSSSGAQRVELVGYTSATKSGGSFSMTVPSGAQAGDLLLAIVGCETEFADVVFYGTGGWNVLTDNELYVPNVALRIWSKIATGSETTISVTNSRSSDDYSCVVLLLRAPNGFASHQHTDDVKFGERSTLSPNPYTLTGITPLAPSLQVGVLYWEDWYFSMASDDDGSPLTQIVNRSAGALEMTVYFRERPVYPGDNADVVLGASDTFESRVAWSGIFSLNE